jgi:hypothetical protein
LATTRVEGGGKTIVLTLSYRGTHSNGLQEIAVKHFGVLRANAPTKSTIIKIYFLENK